ncbi:group I truncated hemoglobin [Cyclobacterium sp. SYSU L10401]|uniref:group I truncated hemoglobin n=1 Tax=Cyclobacterium sp. SYSU L10401 TaxID=2678657 RepID=UPI0013D368FF|nr:group 1 truncated hemoglobin [Cyclobacterium sp. SYSU L10401]
MEPNTKNQSLYERLGKAQGISALVDDIIKAHMANAEIKARFLPYKEDPDNLEEIKSHLANFLCAGSGGPEQYTGRDMPAAHKGMNISEAEYLAATDDIMMVLKQHGIYEESQKEVLAVVYSLKEEIVRL